MRRAGVPTSLSRSWPKALFYRMLRSYQLAAKDDLKCCGVAEVSKTIK